MIEVNFALVCILKLDSYTNNQIKNRATFLQHGFPNQPKSKTIFLLLPLQLFRL